MILFDPTPRDPFMDRFDRFMPKKYDPAFSIGPGRVSKFLRRFQYSKFKPVGRFVKQNPRVTGQIVGAGIGTFLTDSFDSPNNGSHLE